MKEIETKDGYIEKTTKMGDTPVLVKFYADWCAPCKALEPILDQLGAQLFGAKYFFKFNIDTDPELVVSLGIRTVPTLVLYKGGKILDRKTGITDINKIIEWLESHE